MLDHEETMRLIGEAQAGDESAKSRLLEENMPLIKSIIKRYRNTVIEYDDLIQLGSLGLYKAIMNFNQTFGVRFSTYAVPMIIGEVRRYLRDNNSIRVSRSLRDTAYKALQAKETLTKKNQKEPSLSEIAKYLDVPLKDVVTALDAIQDPISLFEPVFHDNSGDALYVMDQVKDNKNKDDSWLENISLSEAMKKLTEREKYILNLRFFQGKTQMEVSSEIGISQAQVSRLEKSALKHMRKYM